MALNWTRWRDVRTGRPLAKARVEYVIAREDLVNAAAQAIADRLDYRPERIAIGVAAKRITKSGVEKTLMELLSAYGGIWIEGDSDGNLPVEPEAIPLIREYAEARIRNLYPELEDGS